MARDWDIEKSINPNDAGYTPRNTTACMRSAPLSWWGVCTTFLALQVAGKGGKAGDGSSAPELPCLFLECSSQWVKALGKCKGNAARRGKES